MLASKPYVPSRRNSEPGVNQVILAWMRQSDPPVLPIIAGSRTEQLAENIAALDLKLTDDQMRRLDTAGNAAAGGWIKS